MPSLIYDILFEVGKEVFESGDQNAVNRFAFSGRRPFLAMRNVFDTVTTLKLYGGDYDAGWDNKLTNFEYRNDIPHSKVLMNQIGYHVDQLHIERAFLLRHAYFEPIMANIIKSKSLTSFSTHRSWGNGILDEFLQQFSKTLKHVTIHSIDMTERFRDSFNLESLTAFKSGYIMFPFYCCKTITLDLPTMNGGYYLFHKLVEIVERGDEYSGNLTSVKYLTLNETSDQFPPDFLVVMMEYFPSIDTIIFNVTVKKSEDYELMISNKIDAHFVSYINESINIPSKVIFKLSRTAYIPVLPTREYCETFVLITMILFKQNRIHTFFLKLFHLLVLKQQ